MKRLILIVLLLLAKTGWAQSFIVQGSVVDAETKVGLANALVFVDGSTNYTNTDSAGRYRLHEINGSNVVIVVALKGFEALVYETKSNNSSKSINFELVASPVAQPPFNQELLNKWSLAFLSNFFGTSKNSADCELLNPEALRFSFNDSLQNLEVSAVEPLQIINEGLGYFITCQLDTFVLNLSHNTRLYIGYTFFKNLNSQRSEIVSKWNQRRREAYNGSIGHFFSSLYKNSLLTEGFEMHEVKLIVKGVPEYETLRKSKDYTHVAKGWVDVKGEMREFISIAAKKQLEVDSVRRVDSNTGNCFFITSGVVQVIYNKEREEIGYLVETAKTNVPGGQKSFLIPRNKLTIYPNGKYSDQHDLSVRGYMEWEKLSELLPTDYLQN